MKNLYYLIWVDSIVNSKDYRRNDVMWKTNVFFLITTIGSLNLFTVLLWIEYFGVDTQKFLFTFKSNSTIVSAVGGFLNFALPIALVNYLSIFYKDRYLELIKKYPNDYNGKLALFYTFGTLFLVIISVIITS